MLYTIDFNPDKYGTRYTLELLLRSLTTEVVECALYIARQL